MLLASSSVSVSLRPPGVEPIHAVQHSVLKVAALIYAV